MDFEPASNEDPRTTLDTEPDVNDDTGLNIETGGSVLTDDPRTTLDTEPDVIDYTGLIMETGSALASTNDPVVVDESSLATPSTASQSRQSVGRNARCVNCGVDMRRLRCHQLEIVEVRSMIQQWVSEVHISSNDYICNSCWNMAWNQIRQTTTPVQTLSRPTRLICVSCGRSLRSQRFHYLTVDRPRENRIREIISEQIAPRQLTSSSRICHPCWQRSDRATRASNNSTSQTTEIGNSSSTVTPEVAQVTPPVQAVACILPNYKRVPDTQRQCFMPGCTGSERLKVPSQIRVRLFCDYKYYIPKQCRICDFHLRSNSWHLLEDIIENPLNIFTPAHIEETFELLQDNMQVHLDFQNIDSVPGHMVHYYCGLSKEQIQQLYNEVPSLHNKRRGMFALISYIIKIRTGDSDERMASLLNTPRSTLERLMKMAREALTSDFVPANIGINHISRNDIRNRNLLIPNGLFGGVDRNPIIIADGTYVYIEKSSNYLYQKNTYSLHKYRNLVKPFLFVCTDGYIIDVLGPYPATTSDAEIIDKEFSNENSRYKRYFHSGDVFILDRGFRDSISLLESLNYSVHVPKSLQPGKTQLSTMDANASRAVTLCRWVVECVNGIFKTAFKIFRQAYFNTASRHLIEDFRIAAAIINRFHVKYRDRDDAHQILEIVRANLYRNNELADFVDERHLNRIRVSFSNIDVSVENVREFPQLTESELILFACGTYQIKQARSYYGEHVRENGCYKIEVANEMRTSLLEGSHFGNNSLLLRAKIQSRHVSRKTYFIYILLKTNLAGRSAIEQYCCNCIVGRRTVGCCAHVMSVVWYLGWARHQNELAPPAEFLDSVLLTYEAD